MSALLRFLARPVLFFYAVPWLMLLLVAGTLAQRELGLYRAEQTYFSSLLLWVGPEGWQIPLPGGLAVLGVITLNLLAKLFLQKQWRGKIGTSLTHVSMVVLLLGGAVTALTREEGFMELAPAATGTSVEDYHAREFVISANGMPSQRMNFADLHPGLHIPNLPFSLAITETCRHCSLQRAEPKQNGNRQPMQLRPEPLLPQDEANLAGVTFSITGLDAGQDGTYIAFKPLQTMPEVTTSDGRRYRFSLQRVSRPLPFSIRLDHFEQRMHPGTRLPQAYRSDVTITDGAAHWQTSISMNEPLRYRGYTLYQASFVENQESTNSVLTVVRDRGQIFPYLAIACACIGMLIHLVTLARRRQRQPA